MQRHLRRALTTSIYPLIGLAALLAVSGCAAVPAISMASSLLRPAQPAQPTASGTTAPAPDIFTSLAQRLGITLPPPATGNAGAAQTQTDAPSVDMPAKTATASR
jgi:hypothetical protein